MVAHAGNTVRKLTQAEYAQADAAPGTCAAACKTKLMITVMSLAVSSVAPVCMCVINTLVPTSFSPKNACYPTG